MLWIENGMRCPQPLMIWAQYSFKKNDKFGIQIMIILSIGRCRNSSAGNFSSTTN
jgi:hypothetical protein